MVAGESGGLYCGSSGTLGVLVKPDGSDGKEVYLLSCSHVIARSGRLAGVYETGLP